MENEIKIYNIVRNNIIEKDPMKIGPSEEKKMAVYSSVISDIVLRINECSSPAVLQFLLMVIFGYHFPISQAWPNYSIAIYGPLAASIWDEIKDLLEKNNE